MAETLQGSGGTAVAGWRGMKWFHVLEVPVKAELQRHDSTVCLVVKDVPQGQFAVRLVSDSGSRISVLRQADCQMRRVHQSSRYEH